MASEVRKQLGWSAVDADLFHFRDRSGIEVDLVLETRDGRVAGIVSQRDVLSARIHAHRPPQPSSSSTSSGST